MAASSLADLYALDPVEFEQLVGSVFSALGYDVRTTKRSGDEGIDLELRRGDERSLAQCKRIRGTVGQPEIRDFYGVLIHENAARGYFVTTGQFSLAASTWAQGKQIALTDGVDLFSALENSGLVPQPRPKTHLGGTRPRLRLDAVVAAALEKPEIAGRILLDGAPPEGHSYSEVAAFLEQHFPKQVDAIASPNLKGRSRKFSNNKTALEDWSVSDSRIRLIDEFDGLTRAAMESVLESQRDGIRNASDRPNWSTPVVPYDPDRGARILQRKVDWENAPRHSFVLVATIWEKRISKSVRARFSTRIPVHELVWSIFAAVRIGRPKRAAPGPAATGVVEKPTIGARLVARRKEFLAGQRKEPKPE